jgi:anion-transporting  ArsA/GET3 family ATPase
MTARFELINKRLLICLGTGGVGKTTIGAALALDAALAGRAVEVMTIDPAPRLLDAFGLQNRPTEPQDISLEGLVPQPAGRLRAFRLDPKRTFDRLIQHYAPSLAACQAILSNRIYQGVSAALPGVADYMAAEQLLDLWDERGSDLIVVDTPPAHEALNFLDAPRRMQELLSSRALALLGASKDIRRRLAFLDVVARAVLRAFDQITGLHLLNDVESFVRSFDGMYEGFAERAARFATVVHDPASALLLISSAEPHRLEQTRQFASSLNRLGLRPDALVINRLTDPLPDIDQLRRARLPASLKRKLERNFRDYSALHAREAASVKNLRELAADIPVLLAKDLDREPGSLKDLVCIARSMRTAAH